MSLPGDVDSALGASRFRDDYESEREALGDDTVVGYTGYPDYPVERVETGSGVAILEGRLYDVADERVHLRHVASALAAGRRDAVADWQLARDGDFVVAVSHEDTGEVSLLNDTFGRLPVYYATVDGVVVVTRELAFLREMARRAGEPLGVDALGIAQQLLFGYCLGDRTIFEGVKTVPPGSLVRIDDGVRVDRLFRHDFEEKAFADRSVEENADALAERFATACENRSRDGATDVVSLSGGLDSRAVAAAYVDAGIPMTAATYDQSGGGPSGDARMARAVARTLGVDWELYDVAMSNAHQRRLLDMKQGMNYLAMAFILDFFEQLQADHGSMTYVTGDGGDKTLVDLTPSRSLSTLDETVEYVIREHGRIPPAEATAVADVAEQDLVASVAARLASYPESAFEQQYAHFLVRERGVNFLNQGEDRNRYYFWSVSPFYSPRVFRYAMHCPDEQKRNHRLYEAFLDRFAPGLSDVPYADFGAPITSWEYRLKRLAFDVLSRYPTLKKPVVKLLADDGDCDEVVAALESQLSRSDLRPLSADAVGEVVRDQGSYRPAALYYLYTMTSVVEDVNEAYQEGRRSPLV